MTEAIGRTTELCLLDERSDITLTTDLRQPQYRREVFLRFYEFHLRYRAHPGCVYYIMPALVDRLDMSQEEKLWFAYINGNSQNPVMTYLIFNKYRSADDFLYFGGAEWFNSKWDRWGWDTDRRYQKKDFPKNVEWYAGMGAAEPVFEELAGDTFQHAWKSVRKFPTFGRLSAFSYMEYLRIMGVPLDCNDLFLEDMDGSRSHRNGLAKVLGRDDLDFADKKVKPTYALGQLDWLKEEAELLLAESQKRFKGRDFSHDVTYFTLESTFCTYKSWHRENRRYANVYNDMLHDRIRWAEAKWPEVDFSIFWDIRRQVLPKPLRLEDNPGDVGVKPEKQNHYRETGRTPMLGYLFPEMWSEYDTKVQGKSQEEWWKQPDR